MNTSYTPRTRLELAQRVAQDIASGSYVNLGIGLPTLVANYLPPEREVVLHTENGLLGMGPEPEPGKEDYDIINAGKLPVTCVTGASVFDTALSFGMMRGGHLDYSVLGAFQVSVKGDIANWHTGDPQAIPAVGGAMDLTVGAKNVYVMMELFTKKGVCKLVEECTYPLTGMGCIQRVFTDHAIFDITKDGVYAYDLIDGLSFDVLQERCTVTLLQKS